MLTFGGGGGIEWQSSLSRTNFPLKMGEVWSAVESTVITLAWVSTPERCWAGSSTSAKP
jgi:hypothetical protein